MSEPFLGEVKMISWNYPPKGWTFCNGQLLPINQNQALFSLLGTTFGGNGQTTFALPNLQARSPIHQGNGFTMGQASGESSHTVTISEMPAHTHFAIADTTDGNAAPTNNSRLAASTGQPLWGPFANPVAMAGNSLSNVGGSQPHENEQPYLVINFIIALQGIFPSRN